MEARWPRGSATQPSKQPNLPAPALPLPPRLPLVPPQASRPAEQAEQTRLQTQAFEAINEVVRSSAADTTPMVVQLIPLVVGKLQETLGMNPGGGSAEAAERQSEIQVGGAGGAQCGWAECGGSPASQPPALSSAACLVPICCVARLPCLPCPPAFLLSHRLPSLASPARISCLLSSLQGLLCGMTQVLVQKLSDSDSAKAGVLQYADHIMEALLAVFACRKDSVHEEAMLAVVSAAGEGWEWWCTAVLVLVLD